MRFSILSQALNWGVAPVLRHSRFSQWDAYGIGVQNKMKMDLEPHNPAYTANFETPITRNILKI